MDVISLSIDNLSRIKGQSAIAFAAYIARYKLYDERKDLKYDFSHKRDLVHSEIMLPENAPEKFYNRESLWNSVEKVEKNKNAKIARVLRISLPKELDHDTQIKMTKKYIKENFVNRGMVADFAIHDKKDGNPHIHVLLTTRSIDEQGNWMQKTKMNYILDSDGNKIYDKATKRYKCGKVIYINNWDDRENAEIWRASWAKECNERFKELEIDRTVTHMSYRRQGIDKIPTIHLGARVHALEKKGKRTNRGDRNIAILERNTELQEREKEERLRELERLEEMDRDYTR